MNFVNKIFLFIVFLGVGYLVAGLMPRSMMEDQQEKSGIESAGVEFQDKSRAKFLKESMPKNYPLLIKYLTNNMSETLSWRDESGADKKVYLSFSHYQGLVIDTELYLGASSNDTPISAQPLQVRMVDKNTDGVMDSIEMTKYDGDSKFFRPPFDEIQKYMWDASLAIAFTLSRCCSLNQRGESKGVSID